MKVEWTECFDNGVYDADDYHVWSQTYRGEVMGTVRSWGETLLVVMLDSGTVKEVRASRVKRVVS